ncbi:MAG: hypothetical protein OMM_10578, partial [Candidatus Magnetoglobus multicellularis str. Araruama]
SIDKNQLEIGAHVVNLKTSPARYSMFMALMIIWFPRHLQKHCLMLWVLKMSPPMNTKQVTLACLLANGQKILSARKLPNG